MLAALNDPKNLEIFHQRRIVTRFDNAIDLQWADMFAVAGSTWIVHQRDIQRRSGLQFASGLDSKISWSRQMNRLITSTLHLEDPFSSRLIEAANPWDLKIDFHYSFQISWCHNTLDFSSRMHNMSSSPQAWRVLFPRKHQHHHQRGCYHLRMIVKWKHDDPFHTRGVRYVIYITSDAITLEIRIDTIKTMKRYEKVQLLKLWSDMKRFRHDSFQFHEPI